MQTILHVDMDAFFASVEQRDHPEWRGKPVIVGADPHQRGVVSTCSYEARKFGVHSAMPSREAYRRCPHGIFVSGHMSRYREASEQVFAIFERVSPVIEPVSIDEAFIDVSGALRLFGDAVEIAKRIRQAIRDEVQLTASIGVAGNKFLAKLGSEAAKPDGLFVVPEEPSDRLAWLGKLPIGALWGVGKTTETTLLRYGYRTVKNIREAPFETLRQILGEHAATQLLALARGEDNRQVETVYEEKSLSREHTFLEDCSDRSAIRTVLTALVEDVGRRLRKRHLYASVGKLKLRWKDFSTISRQAPFETAVCDDFAMKHLAYRLFDQEPLIQPVRLIGFGIGGLNPTRTTQMTLFADGSDSDAAHQEKRERLCQALDALNARFKPHPRD